MKSRDILDGAFDFLRGHLHLQSLGLLQHQQPVDQLVQRLLVQTEHFQGFVIDHAAIHAPVLLEHAQVGFAVDFLGDSRPVHLGDNGILTLAKAAYAPKDENDRDSDQKCFNDPTACFFPHYVEHAVFSPPGEYGAERK